MLDISGRNTDYYLCEFYCVTVLHLLVYLSESLPSSSLSVCLSVFQPMSAVKMLHHIDVGHADGEENCAESPGLGSCFVFCRFSTLLESIRVDSKDFD